MKELETVKIENILGLNNKGDLRLNNKGELLQLNNNKDRLLQLNNNKGE